MEDKIKNFYEWLNKTYEAASVYGESEEISVYENVIDKFEEMFINIIS